MSDHHQAIPTRFASKEELTPAAALAAEIRSLPRPSLLEQELDASAPGAKGLATLEIETAGDLIEHLPHTHRDRREVRTIASLGVGEEATVAVTVRSASMRPTRNRRRTRVDARVFDESAPMVAVWWNQPWLKSSFEQGVRLLLHGKKRSRNEFWVTEHELLGAEAPIHTYGLVPVHPAAQGITAAALRTMIWDRRALIRNVVEPLPAALRVSEGLADRPAALLATHFPDDEEQEAEARRRLAFEELFLLQLAVAGRRQTRLDSGRAAALPASGTVVDGWLESLPFGLTEDQLAACAEIDADLAGTRPMQRLLMGEVGSGKTVVALHAMLRAVENRRQAALMAPTETLAEQHLITLDGLLGGLVPVELLTGSTSAARRRDLLGHLASGELSMVVGTHALIEESVEFRDLAVCVVDEQHRFGVRQRAALDAKASEGLSPHVLHMTATPIPRTLALTAYGDLETTVLKELPSGRQPIDTHVVNGVRERERAYEKAREEIAKGRQCFVVCPLVEESEALQAKAATAEAERLRQEEFRGQRVSLIHGQMKSAEKQAAMRRFAAGESDVLVATSVIEVGIDVPNATVIMIEAAERYGLSQLHQLRGRVGRGEHRSLCILFGDPKLPRLEAMVGGGDGFALAEIDLDLRGAGEVLGTRQSGMPQFRVARIPEDQRMLERARSLALELMASDPRLERPEHALLREAAIARFGPDHDPIPA